MSKSVICNGIPGSGTHLLLQIIEGMGQPCMLWPGLVYPHNARWKKWCPNVKVTKKSHRLMMLMEINLTTDDYHKGITWPEIKFLLDNGNSVHAHLPYEQRCLDEELLQINIIRDPRNVLLSHYARSKKEYGLPKLYEQRVVKKFEPHFHKYAKYLSDKSCIVVRYEDLTGPDYKKHLQKLAELIGYTGEITQDLIDGTKVDYTYSGEPSDWTKSWDDVWDKAFKELGGEEILALYGYS